MSAAEAPSAAGTPPTGAPLGGAPNAGAPLAGAPLAGAPAVRRISTRFLRSELWLIFGRRRNQAGMAVLAAVPILIAVAVRSAGPPPAGAEGGPAFAAGITDNGFFAALAALTIELPVMLPIAVAATAGDSVAGEANLGTLRYLLAVPPSGCSSRR